ncbi:MAG: type II toxin-antitoxin system RelE/ParE family toxin [Planctomycetales bacterium]|nr:type II toxin-antitoxin system RelE/ParE family toxin [Planctomycetales bacterium]
MTGPFILTPSAARDLDEILEYVLEHGGTNPALHVYECLHEGFSKVGAEPGIGHTRDDLADESLRVWAVFSYLIVYRPETKPVQIIRVVHGARDVPRALDE